MHDDEEHLIVSDSSVVWRDRMLAGQEIRKRKILAVVD
jgi:hypothetical protein